MSVGAFRDYKRRVSLRYPRPASVYAYRRLARRKEMAKERLWTYALVIGSGLFALGYFAAVVAWWQGCITVLVQ